MMKLILTNNLDHDIEVPLRRFIPEVEVMAPGEIGATCVLGGGVCTEVIWRQPPFNEDVSRSIQAWIDSLPEGHASITWDFVPYSPTPPAPLLPES